MKSLRDPAYKLVPLFTEIQLKVYYSRQAVLKELITEDYASD